MDHAIEGLGGAQGMVGGETPSRASDSASMKHPQFPSVAGDDREGDHGKDPFPVSPADTYAELMLKKTRIDLALLQRYAERMSWLPEGQVYLRLLEQTASAAVDYAQAHVGHVGRENRE